MTEAATTPGAKRAAAGPRIRDVQLIPYLHEGRPSLVVRDPLQLNGHALILPETLAPIVFLADGAGDLETLAARLLEHFNLHATVDDLETILAAFDDVFLLENERFREARDRALAEYREAEFRPPVSAGGSYPEDPAALNRMLQDLLESVEVEPDPEQIDAILSPHIDYARGGLTYAGIWKKASLSAAAADLVVLIGTDHYSENPITLTRQNYATPFGVLPTDQEAVIALAAALGEEIVFEGELFHRVEHSLELPLVWLHHLNGGRPVPILPILCGNLEPGSARVAMVANALRAATAGRRVFTVISGDLAHVGPEFGGDPQTDRDRKAVLSSDNRLLDLLSAGDAAGFISAVRADRNANNVCGAYPLYLGLTAFGFRSGERVGYDQCPADDRGESFVSIGGMTFRK